MRSPFPNPSDDRPSLAQDFARTCPLGVGPTRSSSSCEEQDAGVLLIDICGMGLPCLAEIVSEGVQLIDVASVIEDGVLISRLRLLLVALSCSGRAR